MTSLPTRLQELLSKMDFYGQQRRDNKPCVKTRMYVDMDSWYGWWYRRLNRENKQDIIIELRNILSEFDKCWTDNPQHHSIMNRYLSRMRTGVTHLLSIYIEYAGIVSDLRVILESIDVYRVDSEPIAIAGATTVTTGLLRDGSATPTSNPW